jgi:hypothetical protein
MLVPTTWMASYARGYGSLKESERSAISDFVMLWSVYEAKVLNRNATAEGMIAVIDEFNDAGLLDGAGSNDSWTHFRERLRDGNNVNHRFESLHLRNQVQRRLVRDAIMTLPPGPDEATRQKALALIVHRLRNNLLHGEKWKFGLADQEANFRHASQMLMVWMDMHRRMKGPNSHPPSEAPQ